MHAGSTTGVPAGQGKGSAYVKLQPCISGAVAHTGRELGASFCNETPRRRQSFTTLEFNSFWMEQFPYTPDLVLHILSKQGKTQKKSPKNSSDTCTRVRQKQKLFSICHGLLNKRCPDTLNTFWERAAGRARLEAEVGGSQRQVLVEVCGRGPGGPSRVNSEGKQFLRVQVVERTQLRQLEQQLGEGGCRRVAVVLCDQVPQGPDQLVLQGLQGVQVLDARAI